jgi:signal peptidase II
MDDNDVTEAPPTAGDRPLSRAQAVVIAGLVALAGVALDQITKSLAVARLDPSDPQQLIGSLLQLHLTRNPGAAFSTGTGLTMALSLFAIAAACVVGWVIVVKVRSLTWAIAFGLLGAGILGNITDRIFREPGALRGHVVDFLELPHWPIFNVADICITVAAVLIVLQSWRGIRLDGRREQSDEVAPA